MIELLEERIKEEEIEEQLREDKMNYYNSMSNFNDAIKLIIYIGLGISYYFFQTELTTILFILVFLLIISSKYTVREKVVEQFIFMNSATNNIKIYKDILSTANKKNSAE